MRYISTRGGIPPVSFREAVTMGLATDGGLLLPASIPAVDRGTLQGWQPLSFQELAQAVMSLFIDDIPPADIAAIINNSYRTFSHPEITPLVQVGPIHILELFHGPTLAFKDVALQFLGNIFEYILLQNGGKMNILGATSGDTGSAAIYGVRGKERIKIFILHPYKRISLIQELQMITVADANVFNLAIRGTFDDGQEIVKEIFNDIDFKNRYHLGAVNSINWARILAQVVYYIHAWLRLAEKTGATAVDFSVPTGNFGDIFAGYIAKRMLPEGCIRSLILATNENDLLTRFVNRGDYSKGTVVPTSSPSMDIQISSNFERYLYFLHGENATKTRQDMETFAREGKLDFSDLLPMIQSDFLSKSVTEPETVETISDFYRKYDYILDPHTAVGVNAALFLSTRGDDIPIICLATAHPAKFGEAVTRAIGRPPDLPPPLAGLQDKQRRCEVMDANAMKVRQYITQHAL
jgi:threonine synthase